MLLGDRELTLPAHVAPGAGGWSARPATFTPADLADHLDAQSRLVLCRRLVREGLLACRRLTGAGTSAARPRASTATSRSAGTASTVRAFLLVENAGPWGVDALRDARLPDGGQGRPAAPRLGRRRALAAGAAGTGGAAGAADRAPGLRGVRRPGRAVAGDRHPRPRREQLLDLDLDGARRAGGRRASRPPTEPVFCVCTHGRHDACCAELGRPAAAALAAAAPRAHLGGLAHRRRPVRGQRAGAARRPLLRPGLGRGRARGWRPPTSTGHLDLDLLRGRSGLRLRGAGRRGGAAPRGGGDPHGRRTPGRRPRAPAADTTVRMTVAGATYDVVVRRTEDGPPHRLTCRATRDEPAPSYEIRDLRHL